MKYVLLIAIVLAARPACGAGDDCYSSNGTSLRESFRDDDVVVMGRVTSVRQEDYRTRHVTIEPTQVMKGEFAPSATLTLQDFRQNETDVPEPILGGEFLFTLRQAGEEPFGGAPAYMTLGMDRFLSKMWDPLALDAQCLAWRTLLGQWTTEWNDAQALVPRYQDVWMTILSESTGLAEEELDDRLSDVNVGIRQWRRGFYFESQYTVRIDWLESPRIEDKFAIRVYQPRNSLPPNQWLTLNEVRNVRPLRIQKRIPTKIAFRSKAELDDLVHSVTGRIDLTLTYEFSQTLRAWSVFAVDAAANECRRVEVDLESGEADLRNVMCRVTIP